MLDPGVTVVSQHVTEIGTQAAHILFRRIDGDHSIDEVLEVPTTLIARGSGEIVAH
jgi:LacI family transcriptional regulator